MFEFGIIVRVIASRVVSRRRRRRFYWYRLLEAAPRLVVEFGGKQNVRPRCFTGKGTSGTNRDTFATHYDKYASGNQK